LKKVSLHVRAEKCEGRVEREKAARSGFNGKGIAGQKFDARDFRLPDQNDESFADVGRDDKVFAARQTATIQIDLTHRFLLQRSFPFHLKQPDFVCRKQVVELLSDRGCKEAAATADRGHRSYFLT